LTLDTQASGFSLKKNSRPRAAVCPQKDASARTLVTVKSTDVPVTIGPEVLALAMHSTSDELTTIALTCMPSHQPGTLTLVIYKATGKSIPVGPTQLSLTLTLTFHEVTDVLAPVTPSVSPLAVR
jgi:hypothetical protein